MIYLAAVLALLGVLAILAGSTFWFLGQLVRLMLQTPWVDWSKMNINTYIKTIRQAEAAIKIGPEFAISGGFVLFIAALLWALV